MRELLLLMAILANVSVTAFHSVVASLPNDATKEVSSDAWNASHVMTVTADVTGYAPVADTGSFTSLTSPPAIFERISVAGQSTVVAASVSSTLELIAGTNITIEATTSGNAITLNAAAGSAAAAWPVGSVYLSTTPTSPATKLGFGTWSALQGKFIAGVLTGDPEFDAGVSGGSTGTSYTPSGDNAISLFREASAGTNAASAVTGTVSVEWPTGVPVFAGTTATLSASVNWPAGVPTFAGTAHQHQLPMYSTGATSISFLPTSAFGVGTSRAASLRVSATATGPIVAATAATGQVYLSQSVTAAGAITWGASVPQAVLSAVPAGIISWPATAPSAVIKNATAAAQVFTGVTGSVSGQVFTGNQTNIAILPPYFTLYMWERTA